MRSWRGFIEHRYKLVGERTRTKNAIRALLRTHGIQAPRGLWYGPGMKWLRSVSFANELDTVRRDMLYERLCFLTKMIERVEGIVYERVRRDNPERRKIALVATAHFLLRAMMAMLRTGEVWRLPEGAAA